ncbi:hypothetical protein PSACC_02797 [Paramicrosporidium saccamoebae]|uniref:Mitochondrial import receptor subunit TOM40 n=1 Tax=Paramicrosporidium saccamoebae TaxID=1246581 RepID=A0A2H9THW6_9FUNG|nr:hypothetical protein PSACC_02797 [Paramicrosporidium saccamoebae]
MELTRREYNHAGWQFCTVKGSISSIPEAEELTKALEFPTPTMTFPNNSLSIKHAELGYCILLSTKDCLFHVSKCLPKDVRIPDSENQFWQQKSRMSFISSLYHWKQGRDLPNPGTFENLHRESRSVSLTPFLFDGGKADLAKGLSANFQVSHSFSLGSMMMPPSYHFGGIFVSGKHLLHGLVDTNGIFQGKYHFSAMEGATLKAQAQLSKQPGQSMAQLETDLQGKDCSLNLKAINPDMAEGGSGIYTVSMLQSLTKHFSAGLEVIAQKATQADPVDIGYNVAARYASNQWVAAVNVQQMVALQASYFYKVNERVELGTELQMLLFGPRKDAVATMGAKFDYRQALIRTQIDSMGKVGLVYEERLFPGFSLILSGELDHVRSTSRFGFGINLEN